MKYQIIGADSKSGREIRFETVAASESDALEQARRKGVFVSEVVAQEKSFAGAKLFLIISGAIIVGITATALIYGFLGAAISARSSTGLTSSLGDKEAAFVRAVESGDEETIRDQLLENVDWRKVATPALGAIIARDPFRRFSISMEPYVTEERKRIEFWTDLANRMIANGADVNAVMPDAMNVDSAAFLLSHGAKVDSRNALGDTLLIRVSHSDTWENTAALLISKGADVNAAGYEQRTPLHEAARGNAVKMINRLIAAGANVNVKNQKGQTPLTVANLTMQRDAAAALKAKGGKE